MTPTLTLPLMEPTRGRNKRSANSFGTFLEAMQRPAQPNPIRGGASGITTILSTYGPQLLSDLQVKSGMSFTDFAPVIAEMRESGQITVTGDPGREAVALTAPPTR